MKLTTELVSRLTSDTPAQAIEAAAQLCRRFEGYRSKPYLCPAGIPTIGYGTTRYPNGRKVALSDPLCTVEQADAWLKHELDQCAAAVLRQCSVVAVHPGIWAALIDFTYNLGPGRLQTSTLRRVINNGDWQEAAVQLRRWNRGAGRVLPGLVQRREAEVRLLSGYVSV